MNSVLPTPRPDTRQRGARLEVLIIFGALRNIRGAVCGRWPCSGRCSSVLNVTPGAARV